MSVRVKLDEDLSLLVAEPLVEAGYMVTSVAEQGWSGKTDVELWPLIVAEGVFFVTADKGFGDIRTYVPGAHPGIIVMRPDRESILEYRSLLARIVKKQDLESLIGCTTVVTPRGIRVRRSLPCSTERNPN